eukprot:jgi/Mesvir1/7359/Mv19165-RA.1
MALAIQRSLGNRPWLTVPPGLATHSSRTNHHSGLDVPATPGTTRGAVISSSATPRPGTTSGGGMATLAPEALSDPDFLAFRREVALLGDLELGGDPETDAGLLDEVASRVNGRLRAAAGALEREQVTQRFYHALTHVIFDPAVESRAVLPYLTLLPRLDPEPRKAISEKLVRHTIQHLSAKREPDPDRYEFFQHADAFACLVPLKFVKSTGAVKLVLRLLERRSTRAAGVSIIGKMAEICPALLAPPHCDQVSHDNLRQAVAELSEDYFDYDVAFINEAMNWEDASDEGDAADEPYAADDENENDGEGDGEGEGEGDEMKGDGVGLSSRAPAGTSGESYPFARGDTSAEPRHGPPVLGRGGMVGREATSDGRNNPEYGEPAGYDRGNGVGHGVPAGASALHQEVDTEGDTWSREMENKSSWYPAPAQRTREDGYGDSQQDGDDLHSRDVSPPALEEPQGPQAGRLASDKGKGPMIARDFVGQDSVRDVPREEPYLGGVGVAPGRASTGSGDEKHSLREGPNASRDYGREGSGAVAGVGSSGGQYEEEEEVGAGAQEWQCFGLQASRSYFHGGRHGIGSSQGAREGGQSIQGREDRTGATGLVTALFVDDALGVAVSASTDGRVVSWPTTVSGTLASADDGHDGPAPLGVAELGIYMACTGDGRLDKGLLVAGMDREWSRDPAAPPAVFWLKPTPTSGGVYREAARLSRPESKGIFCVAQSSLGNADFITGEKVVVKDGGSAIAGGSAATGSSAGRKNHEDVLVLFDMEACFTLGPQASFGQLAPKKVFRGHADVITCVATSRRDPHVFFSGSRDRTVRLWDARLPADKCLAVLGKLRGGRVSRGVKARMWRAIRRASPAWTSRRAMCCQVAGIGWSSSGTRAWCRTRTHNLSPRRKWTLPCSKSHWRLPRPTVPPWRPSARSRVSLW